MSDLYHVSSSPHVRAKDSTSRIMLYVIIALLPTSLFGIYNFGLKALLLILITIAACVATEWIFDKIVHKKNTIGDLSAVVTGLLLALNLPVSLPWWEAVIGGVFAIAIVKCIFGGLGQNFMNPALGARCFLMVSFAGQMTSFAHDGITGATPLAIIKAGSRSDSIQKILASGDGKTQEATSLLKMFIGSTGGTIGETCAIALLIGAAYLLIRKIISWRIPVCYIAVFAIFILLFGGRGFDLTYLAAELCGGGLLLGAFFMATDYVTSPITPKGQIIFGVLLGLLTGVFRVFGASAEGVSYAIIICNLLVPLIERVTIPVPFGKEGIKDGK